MGFVGYAQTDLVYVRASRKVFVEVNNNSVLIVINLQGIAGQQLMPCTIHLLNIIIVLLTIY
jgi:hypothetical protein